MWVKTDVGSLVDLSKSHFICVSKSTMVNGRYSIDAYFLCYSPEQDPVQEFIAIKNFSSKREADEYLEKLHIELMEKERWR